MFMEIVLCFTKFYPLDRSGMYKQSSVDSSVNKLKCVVTDSLNQAVLYTCTRKPKFLCWFSGISKHYINKDNQFFRRYKKSTSDAHYTSVSYFRKFVKVTNH